MTPRTPVSEKFAEELRVHMYSPGNATHNPLPKTTTESGIAVVLDSL
jgi:hypothetical protein